MVGNELKNIKLIGEGSSTGGEFENIKVTGQGKILGNVKSKLAKVTGECHIKGNAVIDHFNLIGKGTIDGELQCEEIKVTGDLTVADTIKTTNLKMRGFVTTNGNLDVEQMIIKGGFHVNGLMNVGDLSVNLQISNSTVHEIGGENLTIKRKGLFNKPYYLQAEIIEGDNIYLENTIANVVRGNHVEIGPGCKIEKVEYRSTYTCKEKHSKKIVEVTKI